MKGQQNFKNIYQRVKCDDKQLEQINQIENNPYIVGKQQLEDGFILHKIPYDECICLNDLIDAIKSNYVVIFKGQAILIIKAILQHLIKMGEKKLSHQQLNLNNVFIKLHPKSNKFTTYQSIIQIDKIYLVQYLIVQDSQWEFNISQDVMDFKKIINQFLQHYEDKNFNLLIQQVQKLRDINDVKQFKQINDIFDQFIQNYVDVNNQIMKVNELENYNRINKQRFYCEKELLIQLNDILKIQIIFGDYIFGESEKEKQEENETLKESEKLQQYILSHFQPNFVKQFQKYYGDKLQNSYLITGISKKQYNELLPLIDKERQRATRSFEAVKDVIDNCFSQSKQIKQEIFKDYRFDVEDLSKDAIMDQFYKFYMKHSLDHDLTLEEQYKQVNQKVFEDVKQYIQEQYEMAQTLENLQFIYELQ